MKPGRAYPDFRGVMTWFNSDVFDVFDESAFAETVRAHLRAAR